MKHSKTKNTVIIILLILTLIVWGLALAGWIKNSFTGFQRAGNEQEQSLPLTPLPSAALSSPEISAAPEQGFDVSGSWDLSFFRYYTLGYEDGWEPFGMEEVYLSLEIYPGKQFEYEITPLEAYINGERLYDTLATEPQLYTGEIVGDTLRLYLDIDNFYLDYTAEVTDTIEPGYIELPLTRQDGSLTGSYEHTWVVSIDEYQLQSEVRFEALKRQQ